MVPDALRYVPQVKSDIIIQRREVAMAPVEGMSVYQRDSTNTITFNVQGHKNTNQLLDTKSCYFTWECKFENGYPIEDVANLVEEIIISSNGRVLERVRHAQYINWYLKQYEMSRPSKARLGKREGYNRFEDRTIKLHQRPNQVRTQAMTLAAGGAPVPAVFAVTSGNHGWGRAESQLHFDDAEAKQDTGGDLKSNFFENLGYGYYQRNRNFHAADATGADGWPQPGIGGGALDSTYGYRSMKFRLKASGLLSCDKMLPIGWMPLTIQLRLSDKMRCTDTGTPAGFDYAIRKPRMHFSVCTCGQAYAAAMQQRLRGPGITINTKLYDTFFQIITGDKQIVIPSNKNRLSKVYVMLHADYAANDPKRNAFRSSVTGGYIVAKNLADAAANDAETERGANCLLSYQFQVGTEVSEMVSLSNRSKGLGNYVIGFGGNPDVALGDNPNTGMPFLEAYLKSIGAVNGHEQDVEYWGRSLDARCADHEGGELLQTFLSKYFVAVYDGEKFLGSKVESGVDTEAGKDIVVDLRFAGGRPFAAAGNAIRVMALINYHAQFTIRENQVDLSY